MVDDNLIEIVTMLLTALTLISAVSVTYLSYKTIKTNIDTNKSQVLLQCLREYINIQKDRTIAIREHNEEMILNYYRELFDLHWTEYQLWRLNFIDDTPMTAWINGRYRDYLDDYLIAKDEKGDEIKIYYKDCWDNLVKTNYFEKDDKFITFVKYAHDNNIKDALKMNKKKGE